MDTAHTHTGHVPAHGQSLPTLRGVARVVMRRHSQGRKRVNRLQHHATYAEVIEMMHGKKSMLPSKSHWLISMPAPHGAVNLLRPPGKDREIEVYSVRSRYQGSTHAMR